MPLATRIRQVFVLGLVATTSASVALAAAGSVTRLGAKLTSGGSLQGKVVFIEEVRSGVRQKLSIEVQGASIGQELPVLVNGQHLITLKGDAAGRARIELREGGDDPGQVIVPDMKVGDLITVGSANSIMLAN